MPLKFLDSEGHYTDPRTTNLKYWRYPDAERLPDEPWQPPDSEHYFMAADGGWHKMELVKIPSTSEEFNALSWAEIAEMSADAATNPEPYMPLVAAGAKVEKDVQMTGMSGVDVVKALIIGVGQDIDESGNKLGFTFQLRDGLSSTAKVVMNMNSSDTAEGGWEACRMRTTNLPALEEALPSDLKELLKPIKKKTNMKYSGSTLTETVDKLALLSNTEIFGDKQAPNSTTTTWCKGEGERYQWYENHDTNEDRIVKNQAGTAERFWLRSVYASDHFCIVLNTGAWQHYRAGYHYLPCACFCV